MLIMISCFSQILRWVSCFSYWLLPDGPRWVGPVNTPGVTSSNPPISCLSVVLCYCSDHWQRLLKMVKFGVSILHEDTCLFSFGNNSYWVRILLKSDLYVTKTAAICWKVKVVAAYLNIHGRNFPSNRILTSAPGANVSEMCQICPMWRKLHWRDPCHVRTFSLGYRGVPWGQVSLYGVRLYSATSLKNTSGQRTPIGPFFCESFHPITFIMWFQWKDCC